MLQDIAGAFFVLGSILIAVATVLNRLREGAVQDWLATPGEVVDAGTYDGKVRIRYRYEVDNVVYMGDRLTMSLVRSRYRSPRRLLKRYRPGAGAKVYYNPDEPAESVLDRRITSAWSAILTLAVVFFILGLSLLWGHSR